MVFHQLILLFTFFISTNCNGYPTAQNSYPSALPPSDSYALPPASPASSSYSLSGQGGYPKPSYASPKLNYPQAPSYPAPPPPPPSYPSPPASSSSYSQPSKPSYQPSQPSLPIVGQQYDYSPPAPPTYGGSTIVGGTALNYNVPSTGYRRRAKARSSYSRRRPTMRTQRRLQPIRRYRMKARQ